MTNWFSLGTGWPFPSLIDGPAANDNDGTRDAYWYVLYGPV